ncbi:MAG: RNA polymerase sigma factor [Phycisphaerae bacterium]
MAQDLDTIITQAAQGDHDAFECLHRRFEHFVRKQIRNRLAELPEDAVEEVSQEVWQAVVRQLPRYDRRLATFTRWLTVISVRKAITHFNRDKLRQELLRRIVACKKPSAARSEPMSQSEVAELIDAIRECAALLRGREKDVFHLVRFEGMSPADIAGLHGITPGRVRGALSDAHRKVLDCLKRKDLL